MRKLVMILMTLLTLTLTVPAIAQAQEDGYFHTHTCYIALARWQWYEMGYRDYWVGPNSRGAECYGALDLRSNSEASSFGTYDGELGGWGIFVNSQPMTQPGSYLISSKSDGTGFNVELPVQAMNFIARNWDITFDTAHTANGTIFEMMVDWGDPTGELRWKPVQPKVDGTIEVVFNGFSPVVFAKDSPERCPPGWQRFPWQPPIPKPPRHIFPGFHYPPWPMNGRR